LRHLFRVEKDLRAEVADLPHHGGFTAESLQWWAQVAPRTVIQSSSLERLEGENSRQWEPLLEQAQVKRRTTGQEGWVRVELTP
jgi:beta-lactamase superfamily II metal-dependent hydrolase